MLHIEARISCIFVNVPQKKNIIYNIYFNQILDLNLSKLLFFRFIKIHIRVTFPWKNYMHDYYSKMKEK
jgi:hypothetical protein